jgi:hypothetical protein
LSVETLTLVVLVVGGADDAPLTLAAAPRTPIGSRVLVSPTPAVGSCTVWATGEAVVVAEWRPVSRSGSRSTTMVQSLAAIEMSVVPKSYRTSNAQNKPVSSISVPSLPEQMSA